MIDRSPDSERQALEDLLRSDGWAIVMEQMQSAWGAEAYERRLDDTLDGAKAEDELAITRRIRDTFKGVRASFKWPEERVRTLKAAPKQPGSGPAYEQFRRGPR